MARKKFTDEDIQRGIDADPDNPEWTEEDFAKARPAMEDSFIQKFVRRGRGPNKAPTKKHTNLRLNPEVVETFKAGGPGWQTRLNDVLTTLVTGPDPVAVIILDEDGHLKEISLRKDSFSRQLPKTVVIDARGHDSRTGVFTSRGRDAARRISQHVARDSRTGRFVTSRSKKSSKSGRAA
ncbi:MAG: BrnA antitoxin family protein [Proteobacteria bacterium]|nr:BrnA antitoxin family protein [Pseudomonadota bacterium]